jgi:esterase
MAVCLAFDEFGGAKNAPLIILHGFFASSRNWRQVAEKLAVNFHVYVLDMRNHGASAHHADMDYPAMAKDVRQFINQLGLDKASLLGHSMGGKVAMWIALNTPEIIDKLLVVDIAPVSYQHSFDDLINALKELPLDQLSNRKQAELWLTEAIPDLSYRQFLLQNLILKDGEYQWRVDLDIFYKTADNIIGFPDTRHLPPYTGDTLFIAGAESNYIKQDVIGTMFPLSLVKVIEGAGHWVHVQQPGEFIEVVEDFLR